MYYEEYRCPYCGEMHAFQAEEPEEDLIDYGPRPVVIDIEDMTDENTNFRTVIWTGPHLQLALMSIGVGEDIGIEMHPDVDQFIRLEQGQGEVRMGSSRDSLQERAMISEEQAVIVPAGTWHNITNTGNEPMKLYTIYAPPHHKANTVHRTKEEAFKE